MSVALTELVAWIEFQSLRKNVTHSRQVLGVVEKEKSQYKSMCRITKDYDNARAVLLVDIRILASNLMKT